MKASILAVGTELLFGQVVNTNAAYLSRKLNLMGFDVMYHFVVGDNPERVKDTLMQALDETDLVITTGGLGPTQDDLTKETIAEAFGLKMVRDEESYRFLKEVFRSRGRHMAENNLKQADMPEGAKVFLNWSGTAPGFAVEKDGKCVISFPGPPREVKWLWDNGVHDYLKKFAGRTKSMYYRVIRTIGIGESDLEMKLMPLIDGQTDPTIATYAKEGECSFRIASQRDTEEEAKNAVDDMIAKVNDLVGEYIYSYDDEELDEVVVRKLTERGLKLSSAESCTGGLFAASITDVPGASAVFEKGFVTYSPEAKIQELEVPPETIKEEGVVSEATATAMAEGARRAAESDIAVSVTGFAGPDADEGGHPGLAYIGYSHEGASGAVKIDTSRNNRKWNRNFFTLRMLRAVNDILDGRI